MKILALILLLTIFSADTFACKCGQSTLKYDYETSDMIFLGKAVEIKDTVIEGSKRNYKIEITVFEVKEVFKGLNKPIIRIYSLGTDCDMPFRLNCTYLVYSYLFTGKKNKFFKSKFFKDNAVYSTNICMASRRIRELDDSLLITTRKYSDEKFRIEDEKREKKSNKERSDKTFEKLDREIQFLEKAKEVKDTAIINAVFAKVVQHLDNSKDGCDDFERKVFSDKKLYYVTIFNDAKTKSECDSVSNELYTRYKDEIYGNRETNICYSYIFLDKDFNVIEYKCDSVHDPYWDPCVDIE